MLRGWSQLWSPGAGGVIGRTGCWWRGRDPSFLRAEAGKVLAGQGWYRTASAGHVAGVSARQACVAGLRGLLRDSGSSCKLQRTILGWGLPQTAAPVLCGRVASFRDGTGGSGLWLFICPLLNHLSSSPAPCRARDSFSTQRSFAVKPLAAVFLGCVP